MALSAFRSGAATTMLVISGRRKVFYGWWMLAGSVAAVALGAGVSFWSFGLYIDPLEDQFNWSRAEVSMGFSLSLMVAGLGSPIVGWGIDRLGPRRMVLLGAVGTAGTYPLLAMTGALWQWYLFLIINAVFRQAMFPIPFQTLISRWFDRRRGLAIGVLGSGFAMGGMAVVPLMQVVIDVLGWAGSFFFAGAVIAVIYLPLGMFLLRDSPADVGAEVDGDPTPEPVNGVAAAPVPMTGLPVSVVVRMPLFWLFSLGLMTFFYGMFGWMVHGVPYYESVGISTAGAAGLVSIGAGGGMLSRLVFGYIADRVRSMELATMVLAGFLATAMAMLLVTGGSTLGIVLFLMFWIVGFSGGPMIEPLLVTRVFGVAHMGSILGITAVVTTTGLVISPTVAGAIFDATGSYDGVLIMFIGTFALSVFVFSVARRIPRPVHVSLEPARAADPIPAASVVGDPSPTESLRSSGD